MSTFLDKINGYTTLKASGRVNSVAPTLEYVLIPDDANGTVVVTYGDATWWTIPLDLACPVGTRVKGIQGGSSPSVIRGQSGVTIHFLGGHGGNGSQSNGQYAVWEVEKISTNEWVMSGDFQLIPTFNGWNAGAGSYYFDGLPASGVNSSGDGYWSRTSTYYIFGTATTLDSSGNGGYGGYWYILGTQTTLSSAGTGYWGSTYYILGTATTLDSNGDGTWNSGMGDKLYVGGALANGSYGSPSLYYVNGVLAWGYYGSTYYISGVATSLDSNGDGFWDSNGDSVTELYDNGNHFTGTYSGLFYYNGLLFGTGWNSPYYYIDSVQTTLDSSGNGVWSGARYSSGALLTGTYASQYYVTGYLFGSGWDSGTSIYYLDSYSTSLDSGGTGTHNGLFHVSGSPFGSGWYSSTSTYYVESVATTLDSNGDGTWDGSTWIAGVRQ